MTVAAMALMVQQNLVSIEITGLPVRAAIEKIAKLTGTDLRVRDDANVNTLVVFAKDVSPDELLERIASATGTEWAIDGEKRTLVMSDELNKAIDDRDSASLVQAITKAQAQLPAYAPMEKQEIEALVARAEAIGRELEVWIPTEEQRAVLAAIQSKKPISQLANSIAKSLSPTVIASVAVDNPIYFCNKPVGLEKHLPPSSLESFGVYKEEFAAWREAVLRSTAAYPVKNPEDPRYGVAETRPPVTIHVTVDRLAERSYIRFHVRVADSNGDIVDQWYATLRPEQTGSPLVLDPDVAIDVPISLRELRAYMTWQDTVLDDVGSRPLDPSWKSRICSPTTTDPVSLGIGPLLVSLGRETESNLIACVSDYALGWYARSGAIPTKQSINRILADIDTLWEMSASKSDGWIEITPKHLTDARHKYFDRRSLERLFTRQVANRFVSLDDAIEYAGRQGSILAFRGFDNDVVKRHGTFSGNVADTHVTHWEAEKPLRLVAVLTGEERSRAAQGIIVSALGSRGREAVLRWLGDTSGLSGGFRAADQEDYGVKNLAYVPSRVGASGAMRLFIVESQEPMTFTQGSGSFRGLPFADYLEYSGRLYQDAIENTPNVLVQMGILRKLTVRLQLPDGAFVSIQVDQAAAPPGEKWSAPKDLPSDVLQLLRIANEKSGGGHPTRFQS